MNSAHVDNASDKNQVREAEVRDFFPGLEPHYYMPVENPYGGGYIYVMGIPVAASVDEIASKRWHVFSFDTGLVNSMRQNIIKKGKQNE